MRAEAAPSAGPSSPCVSKSKREEQPNGMLSRQLLSELPGRCMGSESLEDAFVGGVLRNSPLGFSENQGGLDGFPMIWDVRVVFLLNGPTGMSLGPQAAQFYSGYGES